MSEINDSAVLLEQKDNFCSKTIKYVGPIISVIFTCGFLSYLICSIAFLIGDFNKSSQYTNCYLWEYCLIYLIFNIIRLCVMKYNNCFLSHKFLNCLIMSIIELMFLISGLFLINENTCLTSVESNLWYISIFSIVIQSIISIFYSYLVLSHLYVVICKIKTPCCCTN